MGSPVLSEKTQSPRHTVQIDGSVGQQAGVSGTSIQNTVEFEIVPPEACMPGTKGDPTFLVPILIPVGVHWDVVDETEDLFSTNQDGDLVGCRGKRLDNHACWLDPGMC